MLWAKQAMLCITHQEKRFAHTQIQGDTMQFFYQSPIGIAPAPAWTRRALILGILGSGLPAGAAWSAGIDPPLMLARSLMAGAQLGDFWVSEKYDGVRGYWDGRQLFTRGGEPIAAPPWFTAGWPAVALDGELWAGRGQFTAAVSAVRKEVPDDAAWRRMQFMVFDLPSHPGSFTERLTDVQTAVAAINQNWVSAVAQERATTRAALQQQLDKVVQSGGEGLVLHRAASLYKAGRSDDLLKFKPFDDAEARVVAHVAGKGKYAGMLGALVVEWPAVDGRPARRFKLGTGLSDAQRRDPPPIGSLVTLRYRGLTDSGVPRFASFMRMAG